ncbi:hypothetical protein TCCBUS3UF1_4080 [Thermus sp. CCB_US3_UF1]|nr:MULTISPECIES: hypothetical protein [unclassified Thermus]AEV15456.1 hypothetical protein TCCBUS3UF1_4080 [Thermus sp. CCB_US3_UF1]MDW8357153.1 hypothetical protein [Thermus sp.]
MLLALAGDSTTTKAVASAFPGEGVLARGPSEDPLAGLFLGVGIAPYLGV